MKRIAGALLLMLAAGCAKTEAHTVPPLRVCADPNNLPFSNRAGEGFENKLADMLARDLGTHVEYTWEPQRRGFFRKTLRSYRCDVVIGVPTSLEMAIETRPYYRSTYVFLTRADRHLHITSLDDTVLRHLRIGVHFIGDDYANTPAATALTRRGLVRNIVGYSIYGDYSKPNPPADLVTAVSKGDVDVAIVWGPLAGYFAKRDSVPLVLTPVEPAIDVPFLQFTFDIAMGVRRGDTTRRATLDSFVVRRRGAINDLLSSYGVPLVGTRVAADSTSGS